MNEINFAMANICRVCETQTNQNNLVLEENKVILKKLRACADVSIDVNDDLPKYICTKCESDLEYSYIFKIKCEYTDRKFRDAIDCGLMALEEIKEDCSNLEIIQQIHVEPVLDAQESHYDYEFCTNGDEEVDMVESMDDTGIEEVIDTDPVYLEEEFDDESDIKLKADIDTVEVENQEIEVLDQEILDQESLETEELEIISMDEDSMMIEKYPTIDVVEATSPTTFRRKSTKEFKCDTCEATFTVYSEFHLHNKSHGRKRYQCTTCDRWFWKRYHLKNHQKIHALDKPFQCEMCSNKYTNQGNLDRHIRVFHNKEKRYHCTECGKKFSQTSILRQHIATHSTERKYSCDICQKKFKTESYLTLHRNRHMPGSKRRKPPKRTVRSSKQSVNPCTCMECGKRFNSTALYLSHKRTHTGEKPYECDVCQRRFSFQQSLKNHKLLHTGEKPFTCNICHLSFRQIGHLQGHKFVHSKQKPHSCLECGKSFALRGNLTVHMRLHTGETPYHCNLCPKKFYDSNGLKRHRQVHERGLTLRTQDESKSKIEICEEYDGTIKDSSPTGDDKSETVFMTRPIGTVTFDHNTDGTVFYTVP